MIITCPSCTARYKINESKIKGKGAKMTCPRCSNRFVVLRDEPEHTPPAYPKNIADLDFSEVGVLWKARRGLGITIEFESLGTLEKLLDDGQLTARDEISYDYVKWYRIDALGDLRVHFWELYQRARRGQIASPKQLSQEFEEEEDSMADQPTSIMRDGATVAQQIQRAMLQETPRPARGRTTSLGERDDDTGEEGIDDEATPIQERPAPKKTAGAVPRPTMPYPEPDTDEPATSRTSSRAHAPKPSANREPPPPVPKPSAFLPELPAVPERLDLEEEKKRLQAFKPAPVAAPAPAEQQKPAAAAGPNRTGLIAAAVATVVLLGMFGLWVSQPYWRSEPPSPPEAPQPAAPSPPVPDEAPSPPAPSVPPVTAPEAPPREAPLPDDEPAPE